MDGYLNLGIAVPSLTFDRTFHIINFVTYRGPDLVMRYDRCYKEMHIDHRRLVLLQPEALRWSQALSFRTPSRFLGIRLVRANRSESLVFVHPLEAYEPSSVDECDNLVINATTDIVEAVEMGGYATQARTGRSDIGLCRVSWSLGGKCVQKLWFNLTGWQQERILKSAIKPFPKDTSRYSRRQRI